MYAYDPTEAFGSWCVKGVGYPRDPMFATRGRHRRRFTKHEQEAINFNLMYCPMDELLRALSEVGDPREQRVIQHVYEKKRRARG